MLDILCKYAIRYTSLVAEQMLGMIRVFHRNKKSAPKKSGWKSMLFPRTLVKENVPS